MRKCGIIYKATSPSGKIYIGQTRQSVGRRKARHYYEAASGRISKLCSAIRKYGKDIRWEVVCKDIPLEELDAAEQLYILIYDSYINGYNMTIGGQNPPLTKEIKKKLSKTSRGRKHSEETKKKMSNAHKGMHIGEKNNMYGKKFTKEHRDKISRSNKKEKTREHALNISKGKNTNKFAVYKNGKLIGIWQNYSECARDLLLSVRSVTRHAKKNNYYHKGYLFKSIKH
jgi:group I intron endonuclease